MGWVDNMTPLALLSFKNHFWKLSQIPFYTNSIMFVMFSFSVSRTTLSGSFVKRFAQMDSLSLFIFCILIPCCLEQIYNNIETKFSLKFSRLQSILEKKYGYWTLELVKYQGQTNMKKLPDWQESIQFLSSR